MRSIVKGATCDLIKRQAVICSKAINAARRLQKLDGGRRETGVAVLQGVGMGKTSSARAPPAAYRM